LVQEMTGVAHGKGNVAACLVVDGVLVTASDDFTVRVRGTVLFFPESVVGHSVATPDRFTTARQHSFVAF
jgi:hypothetical protein